MNRQQRRAAAKAQPRYVRGLTTEQKKARLFKNGITLEDVDKAQKDGWHEGFQTAGRETLRSIYAAIVWQLNREGRERDAIIETMRAIDQRVLESISSAEDIEEVFQESGIEIAFDEPFDRVQEATT